MNSSAWVGSSFRYRRYTWGQGGRDSEDTSRAIKRETVQGWSMGVGGWAGGSKQYSIS